MSKSMASIESSLAMQALVARPLHEWHPILSRDVNVFSCEHGFLAKRFNEINFQFCAVNEAEDIVRDNLFAILRYKYFTSRSDEVDGRIDQIISSFCKNLSTTLQRVTFDENISKAEGLRYIRYLPDGCVAFSNGVYDFRKNEWFFKYDITHVPALSNILYTYDTSYIVQWYLNYHFEPLPIDVTKDSLEELIEILKSINKESRTMAFELIYNMSHDFADRFSEDKFIHMCEILGYCCLQNFAQYFVLIIGAGQNGKNSLFDGCFTNRLVPRPASIDFDTIEKDRFATGSLANKSHNIFLETSAKQYTESKVIKALTGSMYQSIENKNEARYSGIINCKYIFAGNDKDKIKFSDTTTGFIRRINMIEIFYTWDDRKAFLSKGDYYDTSFSDSLSELKNDITNTTLFVYLAMFGIAHATKNFTSYFKFTKNDWNYTFTDVDLELKTKLQQLPIDEIMHFVSLSKENRDLFEESFFTLDGTRVCKSSEAKKFGLTSANAFIEKLVFETEEHEDADGNVVNDVVAGGETYLFFAEHEVFVSNRFLRILLGTSLSNTRFTQELKRAFNLSDFPFTYGNKPFVKMSGLYSGGQTLRIIK